MFFRSGVPRALRSDGIPWIRRLWIEKSTQLAVIRQVTAFPFLRDARRLDYCQFVREPGAVAITSVRRSGVPVVRRMGLGFSPVLRPRLGANQKISFTANCMLNGSPGPIPGAPL
jgi:hypothetical protein